MYNPEPWSKRIAIIGAGPAGLTLARILSVHGIKATIFEREEHAAVRSQGGSLDIHRESGQYALRCAQLTNEFKTIARYDDQEFRLYDKFGALRFENTGSEGDRPEVDRTQLRQILLDSLPAQHIKWDHELVTVQPLNDGVTELKFKNGAREQFDLVVGADGAWSRVRPLLSEVRPVYSGVTFASIEFDDVDQRYPDIAKLVGHGLMFALGESKTIAAHRNAGSSVGFYVGLRVSEHWAEGNGFDTSSPEASRSCLAEHFDGWGSNLLQAIHLSTEPIIPRRIYALPIGHKWENRSGLTLIGDSAHLMSPFAGEGANLAMQDAADLALELASDADWNRAIRRFESKMFARAEIAAGWAAEGIDGTFSEDGLAHALEHASAQQREMQHAETQHAETQVAEQPT